MIPSRIAIKITHVPGPLDTLCWIWTGAKQSRGYGCVLWEGRVQLAHRVLYELTNGPFPPGLQPDHLCRNKDCVNPDHIEPVTPAENMARSDASWVGGERNRAKVRCTQGHPYAGDNLYERPNGERECRTCRRTGMKKVSARRLAARKEGLAVC